MIYEVAGDILLSKSSVIAHGVSANDPMNQGLALALHKRYPAMHKDFHHWCHQQHPKPGEAWMWGSVNGIRIINLITQEGGYGHGTAPGAASVQNVRKSLKALKKIVVQEKFTSLALPKLATGVGRLNWSDVKPLISEQLGDLKIPIYLYSTFQAGQHARKIA